MFKTAPMSFGFSVGSEMMDDRCMSIDGLDCLLFFFSLKGGVGIWVLVV